MSSTLCSQGMWRERERERGGGRGELGREGVMQWGWSGRPLKHSVSLFSQISNLGSPRRTNGAFHTQYCRRLFDSERPLDSKLAPLPYNNLYKSSQVKSSQIKNPESPGNAYIAAHVSQLIFYYYYYYGVEQYVCTYIGATTLRILWVLYIHSYLYTLHYTTPLSTLQVSWHHNITWLITYGNLIREVLRSSLVSFALHTVAYYIPTTQ